MNSKTRVAALVTAGAVGLGALAVAVPAVAGAGPFGHPETVATGPGPGAGMDDHMTDGLRMGGVGVNSGVGVHEPGTGVSATLTESQSIALAAQAEEEKLAGDLYQAFADTYPGVVFDRIVVAEDQHLAAVRQQLTRSGVDDPTAGLAPGQFATRAVQTRYDQLLAQGMTGQSAALQVGVQVEKATIAELQQALTGVTASSVEHVYEHLLEASQQHLTAFTTWASR